MKIRSQLILASGILIACAVSIGVFVLHSARRADVIGGQNALASVLIRDFFELGMLTQEYIAFRDPRPKTQWLLVHERLMETLASPVLRQEPSAGRHASLQSGAEDLKGIFEELVFQVDAPARNAELEMQLASDLLVRSRRVTRVADGLAAETLATMTAVRKENDRMIFVMLSLLVALMILTLSLLYRRIAGSLAGFQRSVRIIGGGDLAHRIGMKDKDEIGELATAFDAMTSKLKKSRDTLEERVKERTQELHDASARNALLLKSIGDGVIAIDRAWNVTLMNPAAVRMTGWNEREAIGKPFRQVIHFIHEHSRKENLTFIEEAMLYGETRQMSNGTLMLTRDGREMPVGDSAAPIFDSAGKISGVIIVFRDATKEREASFLRTDFAYASHQLRTPINKALWGLELVLEDAKPETSRRLKDVHKGMKDVAKLAERLLVVSEIDQGLADPRFKEIDLKPFLSGIFKKARAYAKEEGVKLEVPVVKGGISIDTDPELLADAIHEILLNAVMYSMKGGRVWVELQMDSTTLILRIRDQGIGIDEEQQPLIFTKFFRGQNIPEHAVGAGLGLFIAREYMRAMGGKLWFESKPGEGTTFTLSLPRIRGMRA